MIRLLEQLCGRPTAASPLPPSWPSPSPSQSAAQRPAFRASGGEDAACPPQQARPAGDVPCAPAGPAPRAPAPAPRLARLDDNVSYDGMIRALFPASVAVFADVIEQIRTRNALPDRGRSAAVGGSLTMESLRDRDASLYVHLPALALAELIDAWAHTEAGAWRTLEICESGAAQSEITRAAHLARHLGGRDADRIGALKGIVRFKIGAGLHAPWPTDLAVATFGARDEPLVNRLTRHIIAAVYESGLTDEIEAIIAAACRA